MTVLDRSGRWPQQAAEPWTDPTLEPAVPLTPELFAAAVAELLDGASIGGRAFDGQVRVADSAGVSVGVIVCDETGVEHAYVLDVRQP